MVAGATDLGWRAWILGTYVWVLGIKAAGKWMRKNSNVLCLGPRIKCSGLRFLDLGTVFVLSLFESSFSLYRFCDLPSLCFRIEGLTLLGSRIY